MRSNGTNVLARLVLNSLDIKDMYEKYFERNLLSSKYKMKVIRSDKLFKKLSRNEEFSFNFEPTSSILTLKL